MSIIRAIKHRLGLSVTPANNFLLDASADNGTMKLARESGQDIMTVDAAGRVVFPQGLQPQPGQVLQHLLFTDGGSASLPGTIANITQSNKNITPKSTNSTIFVGVSFYGAASAASGRFINTRIVEVNGSQIGSTNSHGLTSTGNQAVGGWTQQAITPNTALTERSFQLWANNSVGPGGSLTGMVWTIIEVQN